MKPFIFVLLLSLLFSCSQSQEVDNPCPFDVRISNAECGVLKVPAKREADNSENTSISYLVLKSNTASGKDPIVFLQGGPGAGAIASMADLFKNNRLRNDRDIVLVDQRGTGFSSQNCPDLGTQFMEMMALNLSADEEYKYMLTLSETCRSELSVNGISVEMYTTAENAADIDDLRKTLGYEKWVIMGGSYGTRLGLEYMKTYPQHISASILIGLYPHQLSLYANIFSHLNQSLDLVFETCENDPGCRQKYPELKTRFYEVKNQLIDAPFSFDYNEEPFHLNAQDMLLLVHQMLYHPALIGRIPQFIEAIEKEDPEPIKSAVDITAGTMQLINGAMYWSIMSQEELPFMDANAFQNDMERNSHLMPGPAFFISDVQVQEDWRTDAVSASFKKPVKSDVPTLLVNGRFDPVTPISNAKNVLGHLSKGQLVEFPNGSHSLMNNCFFDLVQEFLNDPKSTVDAACAQESERIRWR